MEHERSRQRERNEQHGPQVSPYAQQHHQSTDEDEQARSNDAGVGRRETMLIWPVGPVSGR
jgi:hypothetical protein